jgi:hypothetical protein
VSRRAAWLLFGIAVALAPVGLVLGVVGESRGLDLPAGRGSELFVEIVASIAAILFAAVGLLIARKEPANPIGWIFLASSAMLAMVAVAMGYADLALYGGEGSVGANWAAWLASWLIISVFVAPCLIAQLFPDGRALPGRWRYVLRLSLLLAAYLALGPALGPGRLGSYPTVDNPAGLPGIAGDLIVDATWGAAILLLFGLSLGSVVVRFRRSRGIERQQLTWLALAGGLAIVGLLLGLFLEDLDNWISKVFIGFAFAGVVLMPVAVAIAILRYRLYDIDRIVSRTLVYAALTVVLGAAYVGLVLAGQALFSSFAGGSNLAIAGSTLVVAALFLPVRGRVQRFVDRRFYRRRYDAQRTLEAFGARLRQQVGLDTLPEELRGVVEETMQPTHVTLWLREGVEGVSR